MGKEKDGKKRDSKDLLKITPLEAEYQENKISWDATLDVTYFRGVIRSVRFHATHIT